jgi:hypothetical protein
VLEQADDETVVVAPPPADARPGQPLEAYVLPSRLEAAERIVLSADGRRVTATQPVAAGLVPTEVHVHASLKRGVALELVTPANGLRWRVDGESISRL